MWRGRQHTNPPRLFKLAAGAEVITAPKAFPASPSRLRFFALPVFGSGSRFIERHGRNQTDWALARIATAHKEKEDGYEEQTLAKYGWVAHRRRGSVWLWPDDRPKVRRWVYIPFDFVVGAGYRGGKTGLYSLVASLRPKGIKPLVRFEGLPGEFSQHDFGQIDVEFIDGTVRRIRFFASRLKYSRFLGVSRVQDETVETLVRTLAQHLSRWGGAPLVCV